MISTEYSFIRYLSAKKSVDDRALNRQVWDKLSQAIAQLPSNDDLRVLEIGAGIGTMVERMLDWELLRTSHYTALDAQPENIASAQARLADWGVEEGFQVKRKPQGLRFVKKGREITVDLELIDLFDFIDREAGRQTWDLLVAHAFLDLMDISSTLPGLFRLVKRGSLFYFTINFDGVTWLGPSIDPTFDVLVERLYHQTMDERLTDGKPSGDSRSGRHLFSHLHAAGAEILAAGSSDWVVFPGSRGYPGDEAYFLHFIVHTINQALRGNPELDPARLQAWAAERHTQVDRGELVLIAHQLDFVGRCP
jgi:hypothetical protein